MVKALSLLELIVVMAIIATLMGLGITALTNYRASVNLQSAYTDTVSLIKIMQNKANNSSSVTTGGASPTRVAPDVYGFDFSTGEILPYYCSASTPGGTFIHCNLLISVPATTYNQTYKVSVSSVCSGVGFTRLNTNFVSLPSAVFGGNADYTEGADCVLTLTHADSGDTKTINFNIAQNKVDLP